MKKIVNVYRNMSIVAKASLWFMFCTIIQKCLSIITTPIFTRIMDVEQYGMYSTYLSVVSIVTVILTLNFDTCAYMNGISKFKSEKEKDELGTSLLSFTFILTLIIGIITFFARDWVSNAISLSPSLICLMLIEILFIPPVKFWMVKQRFSYHYKSLVFVTLGMLLFNNIFGIIFVLIGKYEQATLRVLSIVLIQAIVGCIIYIKYIHKTGIKCFWKYWKYGLKLNIPLVPHGLSILILSSSDKLMINKMVGSAQAGIYGVAYSAAQIINAIKLSLVDAIRPWIYTKIKSKQYDEIKNVCNFLFLINILITFIIVGFAPELIKILASKDYYEAIYIIPPVAASSFFTFVYNICSIVEIYHEKNKNIMIASVIAAISNIVLNVIFIKKYGYLAAGYTTLFSYILLSMMHFYYLRKIEKEELDNHKVIDRRSILLMSILTIAGMFVFTFLYNYLILRYILVFIICIVCVLMRKKIIAVVRSLKKIKKEGASNE
ncbi:MAG: oligosaccharide flippase family protein [Clostridia bacterium]|nr:oligosaccharide flippase family protein [Clostridia bacterium]